MYNFSTLKTRNVSINSTLGIINQLENPHTSTFGKVGDGAPIAPITNLLARD
jgi:hypothetical protein